MKKSDRIFFVILALIFVIGGVIWLCMFASIRTPGGTINVTGYSNMEVVADSFDIAVSFDKKANTSSDAQSGNAQLFKEIISIFENEEIDSYRILEENSNTYPQYNWDSWQEIIIGFSSNKWMRFEVVWSNIGILKEYLVTALSALTGVNTNEINYKVKNNKEILYQLQQNAYLDAQTKAQESAQLLEKKLWKLITVGESVYPSNYYYRNSWRGDIYVSTETGMIQIETNMIYEIN